MEYVVIAVLAAAVLILVIRLVAEVLESRRLRRELGTRSSEVDNLVCRVQDALVPLRWSWSLLSDPGYTLSSTATRLRHHLALVVIGLQKALGWNDFTMAEWLDTVPEPPRRLPRYPVVPAYLASAEDAVGMASLDMADVRMAASVVSRLAASDTAVPMLEEMQVKVEQFRERCRSIDVDPEPHLEHAVAAARTIPNLDFPTSLDVIWADLTRGGDGGTLTHAS